MSRGRRPLLEGKSPEELDQFIKQQLVERSLFYEQAQHIIDVDVLSNEEKVEAIVAKIRKGE
jgi:shikimate kinase